MPLLNIPLMCKKALPLSDIRHHFRLPIYAMLYETAMSA